MSKKKAKKERPESTPTKTDQSPEVKAKEAPAPQTEVKEEPTLEQKLEQAEKLLQEKDERYLRLAAEFDNFKKRTSREFAQIIRNANEELITQLLQVLDDFDRALQSLKSNRDFDGLHKGMEMISSNLESLLWRHGLEAIEAKGKPFDPELHEAVMQMPSQEAEEGIILEEITKGYRLNGKVIRHSKVVVSKGKEKQPKVEAESPEPSGAPATETTQGDQHQTAAREDPQEC